jgi:hypothetical protein
VNIHLRNGRAGGHPQTFGEGITWCGKKLLGKPERTEPGCEVFISYGSEVHVTIDPEAGSCPRCRTAFDAAYAAAFPDGLKPIATFRADNPEDMERAKKLLSPETMNRFFGPYGEGMSAYERFINPVPTPGAARSAPSTSPTGGAAVIVGHGEGL